MKIKVILVDDHQLILNGLAKTLNDDPDIKVISTIADPKCLLLEIGKLNPDVLVIDIRIKSYNGIHLTKEITEAFPNIKVVVLSGYNYEEYIKAAFDAGASAFVTKERTNDELIFSIKQAYLGYNIFPNLRSDKTGEILTGKEREILKLIADDNTNLEISDRLLISKRTVERHITSIIGKLGADSRVGAVVNGIKQGLLHI